MYRIYNFRIKSSLHRTVRRNDSDPPTKTIGRALDSLGKDEVRRNRAVLRQSYRSWMSGLIPMGDLLSE